MYYVPQVSKSGCGFACLKMLLANVYKDERYLYLAEDENRGPYSYQELVSIAQRYEVTLIGVKYDDMDDLSHLKSFPLILSMKSENDSLHAVLAIKRKGKKIKIADPNKGITWIKIDNIKKKWDGTALAINKINEKPFTSRVIDAKDTKADVLSYALQSLAALFIAFATFFIKPSSSYFLPILFCALSLVCEISLRIVLLKRMQRCDRYLRNFLRYVNRKDYFEYYKRSQSYKSTTLTLGLNCVFYLLVSILIIAISLFNSLTFVVSIFASLIATLIEVFFISPFKKSIEKSLEEQENQLHDVKEETDMELKVKSLEVKSYRYAYLEFASKIVMVALFIAASFFVSAIDHSLALTNIVFYTCVSFLLYQYLVPLFSFDKKMEEMVLAKVRINNLIHQNDENNGKRP